MNLLDTEAGAPPSASARQAAMLLHSMAREDRQWLLNQLDASHRNQLAALLDQLESLGFPANPALVAEAMEAIALDGPPSLLAGISHKAILQTLLHEPEPLIVMIACCGPWRWQADLFAAMTPHRRRAIEDAIRQRRDEGAPPPALRDALLQGLQSRARLLDTQASSTASPSPHTATASRFSLWRRIAAPKDKQPRAGRRDA